MAARADTDRGSLADTDPSDGARPPSEEVGMKPASLLAAFVFSLVALAHLARLVFEVEVRVDGAVVPMWVSVVGLAVTGGLAAALWQEARSGSAPEHPV
jgi:hypothetical protein